MITKIVITGGPCAGKTTGLSFIRNIFTEKGYHVLFVPETATELIPNGIAPWTCKTIKDFQIAAIGLQKEKEKIFEETARNHIDSDKILIVCDRGTMDAKGFMGNEEFSEMLSELNLTEIAERDNYDAVFHLVTAAKGAEEFYTLENNSARTETVEDAAAVDDRLIHAWTGHPHLRVIDNSTDFKGKMMRLVKEISLFLGEPEPYEIERKFLIEYPDIEKLKADPNCEEIDIIQTYLKSNSDEEIRIRQRGKNGNYIYFKTMKRNISGCKRVETEQRLTEKEYLRLLMDADTNCRPVRKTRYCLTYNNQYFEIDIYPFWNNKAILEIELNDEKADIDFPDFINVIKEVTDDEYYKNHSLSKII